MKPIIFSTEMVKAVLEGRKTQTRRVIKPQPLKNYGLPITDYIKKDELYFSFCEEALLGTAHFKCPYGKVGDRLWVRETFSTLHYKPIYKDEKIIEDQPIDKIIKDYGIRWSPSIFMPKEYCRTTLEITDIRVERVQAIHEADLMPEGIQPVYLSQHELGCGNLDGPCMKKEFETLWDSINKKRGYGWEVNPWVWVVCFKVVKK